MRLFSEQDQSNLIGNLVSLTPAITRSSKLPSISQKLAGPNDQYTDYVATRWYRAPELLVGDTHYGPSIDIWAMGCVVGEMLSGSPLWAGQSDLDQLHLITKTLGKLMPKQREAFERNAFFKGFKFLSQETQACLFMDPDSRPSSRHLLQHAYFAKFQRPRLKAASDQESLAVSNGGGGGVYFYAKLAIKPTGIDWRQHQSTIEHYNPSTKLTCPLQAKDVESNTTMTNPWTLLDDECVKASNSKLLNRPTGDHHHQLDDELSESSAAFMGRYQDKHELSTFNQLVKQLALRNRIGNTNNNNQSNRPIRFQDHTSMHLIGQVKQPISFAADWHLPRPNPHQPSVQPATLHRFPTLTNPPPVSLAINGFNQSIGTGGMAGGQLTTKSQGQLVEQQRAKASHTNNSVDRWYFDLIGWRPMFDSNNQSEASNNMPRQLKASTNYRASHSQFHPTDQSGDTNNNSIHFPNIN